MNLFKNTRSTPYVLVRVLTIPLDLIPLEQEVKNELMRLFNELKLENKVKQDSMDIKIKKKQIWIGIFIAALTGGVGLIWKQIESLFSK
jgi:hypothetical protein